jgi:hypothetical protein
MTLRRPKEAAADEEEEAVAVARADDDGDSEDARVDAGGPTLEAVLPSTASPRGVSIGPPYASSIRTVSARADDADSPSRPSLAASPVVASGQVGGGCSVAAPLLSAARKDEEGD